MPRKIVEARSVPMRRDFMSMFFICPHATVPNPNGESESARVTLEEALAQYDRICWRQKLGIGRQVIE